jgi:hypothetical protein
MTKIKERKKKVKQVFKKKRQSKVLVTNNSITVRQFS